MSERLAVHLVHPGDPFSDDPDGIVSVQRNFIGAAPDGFDFVYWGVRRPRVGHPGTLDERFLFRSVASSDLQRPVVPVSLRFSANMLRKRE